MLRSGAADNFRRVAEGLTDTETCERVAWVVPGAVHRRGVIVVCRHSLLPSDNVTFSRCVNHWCRTAGAFVDSSSNIAADRVSVGIV